MHDFYKDRWPLLAMMLLGVLATSLDAGMVNVILPTLAVEFETDISTVQWVSGLHRLVITGLLLIYGKIGDRYGHVRLFLMGLVAWAFFSALIGFSQSVYQVILFRAFLGVAQGTAVVMPIAIITSVFPPEERGRALGLHTSCVGFGGGLGPVFGGLLTDLIGWRFLFFVNSGIALAALLWGLRWIRWEKATAKVSFDLAGAASVFIFLFSIILWVGQGRAWGWTSPTSLSLLTLAILVGLFLVWIEGRVTAALIKFSLFSNLTLLLGTLAALFNYLAQYMVTFVMPFYIQFVLGFSPSKLGIIMVAIPIANLVMGPVSGSLSDRIGSKPLMIVGAALCTLALISMSWLDAASSPWDVAWRLGFFGFGAATFNTPNHNAIMSSIERNNLGVAAGILTLGRNVGWALGIAVAGTILYGQTPSGLSTQQAGHLLDLVKVAFFVATLLSVIAFVAAILSPVKAKGRHHQS